MNSPKALTKPNQKWNTELRQLNGIEEGFDVLYVGRWDVLWVQKFAKTFVTISSTRWVNHVKERSPSGGIRTTNEKLIWRQGLRHVLWEYRGRPSELIPQVLMKFRELCACHFIASNIFTQMLLNTLLIILMELQHTSKPSARSSSCKGIFKLLGYQTGIWWTCCPACVVCQHCQHYGSMEWIFNTYTWFLLVLALCRQVAIIWTHEWEQRKISLGINL